MSAADRLDDALRREPVFTFTPPTAQQRREQTAAAWRAANDPEVATIGVVVRRKLAELEDAALIPDEWRSRGLPVVQAAYVVTFTGDLRDGWWRRVMRRLRRKRVR